MTYKLPERSALINLFPEPDLTHLGRYRVCLVDEVEGIVVVDVHADSLSDALGTAHTAAETHLNCKAIKGAVAKSWMELPPAWLRLKSGVTLQ